MRSLILRDWEVRAILDGRLTQLRRVVRPQPERFHGDMNSGWWLPGRVLIPDGIDPNTSILVQRHTLPLSPFGVPGDVLWVKEAWFCATGAPGPTLCHYRADGDRIEFKRLWRSSVHMPRWASRLSIAPMRTWVERVQDGYVDAEQWNLDNPRNPWESNPWVWGGEFRKVER